MKTHTRNLIHNIDELQKGFAFPLFFGMVLVTIVLGTIVGFTFSKIGSPRQSSLTIKNDKTAGIADKKTFKDQAEGILKEGGLDGEGNFHLDRPGGISQTVYLTSSTVDLAQYIGKKIRVHGETFKGQKAAWLMDVGLVEIL